MVACDRWSYYTSELFDSVLTRYNFNMRTALLQQKKKVMRPEYTCARHTTAQSGSYTREAAALTLTDKVILRGAGRGRPKYAVLT